MQKKEMLKIMTIAGFALRDTGLSDSFEKKYKCGAKVSYFFDSKDKQIILNWHVDHKSDFKYPDNFPMVNKYHHHKATTFHNFDDFARTLGNLEEQFKIE